MTEFFWSHSPKNYLRLRYEDFIKNPELFLARILALTGESNVPIPSINENQLEIKANHTVSGNPVRFNSGTVTLRLDDEWRSKMKRSQTLIVDSIAWPLLGRYGYAV
jgi:hypothetical protein